MEEEDDDIYGNGTNSTTNGSWAKAEDILDNNGGVRDHEDEEEYDSDSDIDIITEKPAGPTTEPQSQPIKQETVPSESVSTSSKEKTVRPSQPSRTRQSPSQKVQQIQSGADFAGVYASDVDVEGIPEYESSGKLITDLDIDVDLAEHEKSWRRPGSDQNDYFNYGFDEFTWATYCLKQKTTRDAISVQKAESAKFEMMFGPGLMGGIPGGMPGAVMPSGMPGGAVNQQPQQGMQQGQPQMGMPAGMPGIGEMSPDMMGAMMQQMMASGQDPSQMDFNSFIQTFQQLQGGAATGPTGNQNMPQGSNYGSQPQNSNMGYGGGNYGNQAGHGGHGGRRNRRW